MNRFPLQSRFSLLSLPLLLAALGACGGPAEVPDGGPDPVPVVDAGSIADAGPVASLSLLTTVPSAGATGASLSTALALGFSLPVAQASLSVQLSPAVTLGNPTWAADGTEVSYAPLALTGATSYTVTISATGLDGAALAGERSFTFTTATLADTTAPSLMTSNPAQGATNVVPGQAITLTFSEAMSVDSLTLTLDPAQDLSAAVWNVDRTVATISAAAPLASKTVYTLSLSGSDLAGNPLAAQTQVSFTTAAPADVEAPTVLSSAPSPAATAVPTNAVLSLSFSEPMNKAAVDGAFSIVPAVAGTVLWDGSSTLRSFQPSAPLASSTQYTVTLGIGATDPAGNALAAPHTLTFTTAAAPDVTNPTVVSTSPGAGATGVARTTDLSVSFSEPMDKASVQVAFAVTIPALSNVGVFSWSADGKTMTFNPNLSFDYGATVAWRLNVGAKDLAGNPLGLETRGFAVVRSATVAIDASATLDGYVTNGNLVSTASSNLLVGDSASNIAYRSFLSFDLSSLPASLTRITAAQVSAYVASAQGDPSANLGGSARLQRLDFGATLTAAAYDKAPFTGTGDNAIFANSPTVGWRQATVVNGVSNDWTNRATRGSRSQFGIRMPDQVFANSQPDLFSFYSGNAGGTSCPRSNTAGNSCKPYLLITYEYL